MKLPLPLLRKYVPPCSLPTRVRPSLVNFCKGMVPFKKNNLSARSPVAWEMKPKGYLLYVENKSGHVTLNQKFILPSIPFPSVANNDATERHSSAKHILFPAAKASNHRWFSGSLRPDLSEMVRLQLAGRLKKSLNIFSLDVVQGVLTAM